MAFRGLTGIQAVCFDFDGPLCPLFAGVDLSRTAQRVRRRLRPFEFSPEQLRSDNPHQLLLHAAVHGGAAPDSLAGAARLIEKAERKAVRRARPTPDSLDLVRAWSSQVQLCITSNNSAVAIGDFLRRHGLADPFGGRVFGRDALAVARMKPNPHTLRQALHSVGLGEPEAHRCLLIGDTTSDAEAARKIGMRFVGYVDPAKPDAEARAEKLIGAGADYVAKGLRHLMEP